MRTLMRNAAVSALIYEFLFDVYRLIEAERQHNVWLPDEDGVLREAFDHRHTGFDFVPRSPLNSVQMPAKQVSGRSSLIANQTTSFFFVSGFGSGAYSAKLLKGTSQRFSALSHARQCGDVVLRMLVTGYPPARGGGGIPQRIIVISSSPPELRTTGAG